MAVDIQLGADIVWGTAGLSPGTVVAALGKVLSYEEKPTAKIFEQTDEDDNLYGLVIYDPRTEVTMEVLASVNASLPVPGSTLEINNITSLICKDASSKWAVGATQKISISAFCIRTVAAP